MCGWYGIRPDLAVQAALVSGGLVFVDQALVGRAVDGGDADIVSGLCLFLVTGSDRLDNILDAGSHQAALMNVVLAAFLRLTRTLPSLS